MQTKWQEQTDQKHFEIRGTVSVPPHGVARSVDLHVFGMKGAIATGWGYGLRFPGGRTFSRARTMNTAAEAQHEAEMVARILLSFCMIQDGVI